MTPTETTEKDPLEDSLLHLLLVHTDRLQTLSTPVVILLMALNVAVVVIGWQLNNEPPAIPDYSPSSQEAFRQWLKNRSKPPEVIRQPKLLLLQERNEYRRTNRFIPVNLSFLPTENIPFFSIWEAWEINILLP